MRALYAGSFDPPTLGHLDIVRRAAALAGDLVVGIGINPDREPLLGIGTRLELLQGLCADLDDVSVRAYEGATVHFAEEVDATVLVRGIRGPEDWPHESALADANRHLGIETLLLPAAPSLVPCRGSLVRELHAAGLDVSPYVPPAVAEALAAS